MRRLQAARGTSISPIAPAAAPPGRAGLRSLFVLVALLGVVGDVVTKLLVVAHLRPGVPVPVVGNVLRLRLIRNAGAAFSLGEGYTYVFALLSAGVLGYVVLRLRPRIGHPGWAVALGLLCAGVTGNLIDRIFRAPGLLRGHVVDFLQLPRWPIFNVADMCITSAAVLILVLSVVKNVALSGERYARGATGGAVQPKQAPGSQPELQPRTEQPHD